eukprot:2911184-Amphidinium_carterae.1
MRESGTINTLYYNKKRIANFSWAPCKIRALTISFLSHPKTSLYAATTEVRTPNEMKHATVQGITL